VIDGTISLGAGNDLLLNGHGRIEGNVDLGDGDDQYVGGQGDFVNGVTGGLGNDTYFLRGHLTNIVEAVDGGTADAVQIDVSATLAANVENLFLVGGEDISGRGNVLANQIIGNGGDNRLYGGGGADILLGGVGADLLNGGGGSDTVFYEDSDEGVVVNLAKNTASGGSADGDKFVSIENLYGSGLADILIGSVASNVIQGLAGDDKLDGGKGNDFLTGGDGNDTFVFAKGYNHDTIEDFQINGASADQINLHALKAQFSNFADIKAHHMTDHGTDVDITFGTGTLTIINVQKADLTIGDFVL
jgi:Ca2+-binding RTX toxin-like protein